MQETGLFWHQHHQVLLEWCYSYQERAEFIRSSKNQHEVPTRLRLFQLVKGELPAKVHEAKIALDKTLAAREEAGVALAMKWALADQCKARVALERANLDYNCAWVALDRALAAHKEEIGALHKQECLNCPWNGETIFP